MGDKHRQQFFPVKLLGARKNKKFPLVLKESGEVKKGFSLLIPPW